MRIFIIIVNWNGKDDTVLCLRSLQSAGIALSNIILTDNGSTDKSAETVTGLFPEVHLVRNKENLGYAGGNNSGIKYALAMGAEAVVLLNNDTEVDPGFLPPLLAAFYEGETVGIAGSKIYFYDRTDLVWFGSPVLNTTTGRTYDTEYGRRDFSGRAIREVPFISGCAFAVKRDVIDKIGLLIGASGPGLRALRLSLCRNPGFTIRGPHRPAAAISGLRCITGSETTFFL